MFKENTKRRTACLSLPVHAVGLLVIGTTLALAYVWLDMSNRALGNRASMLERQLTEIQKRYDNELWKWETATSPSNIEDALVRHDIAMVWPDDSSIVRLYETDTSIASLQDIVGQVAQFAQTR